MDLEDVPARLLVGRGKFDLAVDASGADEGRVQRLDVVGRQDHLDVSVSIKSVELVEQLEHGALDLTLATAGRIVPFGADRIDLINEDNSGCVLLRHTEQLAHQLRSVSQVLLDEL